jgi:hypothetical protein
MLVKEQARDLHPFDGWYMSTELNEIHARMDRI